MAYSEVLADRIRSVLGPLPDVAEIKMFGGICFTTNGNMFAGVIRDDLMLKVDRAVYESALTKPGARPMDFTGRTMPGMLYIDEDGTTDDASFASWVHLAYDFMSTQPAKVKKAPKAKKAS